MNDRERTTELDRDTDNLSTADLAAAGAERRDATRAEAQAGAGRRDAARAEAQAGAQPRDETRAENQAGAEPRDDTRAETRPGAARRDEPPAEARPDADGEPLFAEQDAGTFRASWQSIQAGFVDEPRRAVEQADKLVAEVIQRLAQVFAAERAALEAVWSAGDVETEQLRVALRRYRSFFDRLLSV